MDRAWFISLLRIVLSPTKAAIPSIDWRRFVSFPVRGSSFVVLAPAPCWGRTTENNSSGNNFL